MAPEEKYSLTSYTGLDGLTGDDLDQLCAARNEAVANASRLPVLSREVEPAHIFFVPCDTSKRVGP